MPKENGRRTLDDRADVEKLRGLNLSPNGNIDRVGSIVRELSPAKLSQIYQKSAMPGDMQRLFELYEKIESYDGKIKGLVEKRRKAPTRFPTKLKLNYPEHERASEVYEFIRKVFKNLDKKKLMRNTMNGILHGVHLREIVWAKQGDYLVIEGTEEISSSRYSQNNESMGQEKDEDWGKLYIHTGYGFNDRIFIEDIDDEKLYKAIYKNKRGFYDLAGVMRPLCKWYLFKYFATQYWIEYDETYGFPTTVVTVPKNDYTEFKDELEEFLQNVGRNKFGILFDGMDYEIQSQQSAGQVDIFKELARFANREIIYCITGQDLTESGDSSQGSYAESVVGYDIETDLMIDDAEFVDKTINKNIIEPLIEKNFNEVPKDLVTFYTNTPERKDWQKITKKYELAAKLGMEGVDKKEMAKELEIPLAEEDDDSVNLFWRPKTNTGGEHPPAPERDRNNGGSVAENE